MPQACSSTARPLRRCAHETCPGPWISVGKSQEKLRNCCILWKLYETPETVWETIWGRLGISWNIMEYLRFGTLFWTSKNMKKHEETGWFRRNSWGCLNCTRDPGTGLRSNASNAQRRLASRHPPVIHRSSTGHPHGARWARPFGTSPPRAPDMASASAASAASAVIPGVIPGVFPFLSDFSFSVHSDSFSRTRSD